MIYILIPTTKERRSRLDDLLESLRKNDFPHTTCIYENNEGAVKAIHKMMEGINGLMMPLCDDHVLSPDYLEKLCTAYHKVFPDNEGIAQGYNQIQKGRLLQNVLCHSDICKKYFYKGYIHSFVDTEFTEVVKIKGIPYLYVPEAIAEHRHVTNKDRSLMDETYRMAAENLEIDRQLFYKRKAKGFTPLNDEII